MEKNLLVLSLMSSINGLACSLFWTIFNLYLWDIGFSLLEISILNASATIISLLFSRFFGKLSDYTRKKPFIATQFFLNSIIFLIFYLVISMGMTRFNIFIILYIMLGFAGSIGGGALMAAVTTSFRRKRTGEATGTFLSFSAIGWTVGSFLSGFIADNFGILYITLSASLLIFVSEVLLLLGYSEVYVKRERKTLREIFAETWSLQIEGDTRSLLLLFLVIALFNFGGAIYNLAFTIKMYIIFETKTMFGVISGFCGISNMIAPYLVGRYSDRVSKEKMLLGGLIVRDIFMLYLAISWSKIATIIFMVTPMWVFINIPIVSLTTEYSGLGHESETQSIRGIVAGCFSTIGSITSGVIAEMIDLRNNISAMYIILLIGCVFYFMALIPSIILRKNHIASRY